MNTGLTAVAARPLKGVCLLPCKQDTDYKFDVKRPIILSSKSKRGLTSLNGFYNVF